MSNVAKGIKPGSAPPKRPQGGDYQGHLRHLSPPQTPKVIFFLMTGKNALKRPWPFFGGPEIFPELMVGFSFMSQGFCWSRGVCWMEVYGADLNFQVAVSLLEVVPSFWVAVVPSFGGASFW